MSIYATVPGGLGRDAELRHTKAGPVLSFSVATDERVHGEKVTTWVRCSLFGKRGESLAQHLTKGSKVTAMGRLTMHEHEGKTYLELNVTDIELQGKPQGQRRDQQSEPSSGATSGGGFSDTDYPVDNMSGDDNFPFS